MASWRLIYKKFAAAKVGQQEALCSLGNGYIGLRGAFEGGRASPHYPGLYAAGVYNTLVSKVAGKRIKHEDLVNLPNPLLLYCYPSDSDFDWLDLDKYPPKDYHLELDLQKALLLRNIKFKDKKGRIALIKSKRLVSMKAPEVIALQYEFVPKCETQQFTIVSAIDSNIINGGVARYQNLKTRHLKLLSYGKLNDCAYLTMMTPSSKIIITEAARIRIFINDKPVRLKPKFSFTNGLMQQAYTLRLEKNQNLKIEKTIVILHETNKDPKKLQQQALELLNKSASFKHLLRQHEKALSKLWQKVNGIFKGQPQYKQILRLNILHLLQTISPHNIHYHYGVPARGLTGEAYRGHIFWDEIFIMPFFTHYFPKIARSLLLYRYERLNMACYNAKKAGFKGAMYPWQSASKGDEVSQKWHLNPKDSTWGPDYSYLQRHVNAAIAYNVWHYYQHTQDQKFLLNYGAEMLLQLARFWQSIVSFSQKKKRYEIKGVVGPDEYHEQYYQSTALGINNNTYTNVMAAWTLRRALEVFTLLPLKESRRLKQKLKITKQELSSWDEISKKMFIPIDKKVLCQFEGFHKLKEFPWQKYQQKYGNIERLDRILKAEGKSANAYQISKQADVVMLFYLFEDEELKKLLTLMGYDFDTTLKANTINYYFKRTSHGSSLSKIVFAKLLKSSNPAQANALYQEALMTDIDDLQGTTKEGIHLGVMAATINYKPQ